MVCFKCYLCLVCWGRFNDTIANSVTDGSMVCFKYYLCLVCWGRFRD
jgi:hypothetical protein